MILFPPFDVLGSQTVADHEGKPVAMHRCGWPYVRKGLESLTLPSGDLLFDDFVERSFFYPGRPVQPWTVPWVGIFHHTVTSPKYWVGRALNDLLDVPEFVESLPYLKGSITLTDSTKPWLEELGAPVLVSKHPTDTAVKPFSIDAWRACPTVAHVGWHLRNQDFIHQVPLPSYVRAVRVRVPQDTPEWAQRKLRYGSFKAPVPMKLSKKDVKFGRSKHLLDKPAIEPLDTTCFWNRPLVNEVQVVGPLQPLDYDLLVSQSVLIAEFLDIAAANTIVEAMARWTPIIINKLPPIVEYLGPSYPLYYTSIEDIPSLLTPTKVLAAHTYLKSLNPSWLRLSTFLADVQTFVCAVSSQPSTTVTTSVSSFLTGGTLSQTAPSPLSQVSKTPLPRTLPGKRG
jgi:hypothetical protein